MPASKATGAPAQPQLLTGRKATRAATKAGVKPAKAPAQRRAPQEASAYAASTWGGAASTFELTVPSGQTCLARDLPLEELMAAGLLDTINGLKGIVEMEVLPKAQGTPQVNMDKVMEDGSKLLMILDLVNTIVCMGVVAPVLTPIVDEEGNRLQPSQRQAGLIYVDSIPTTDRMFLFNELTGGLDQLAAFR